MRHHRLTRSNRNICETSSVAVSSRRYTRRNKDYFDSYMLNSPHCRRQFRTVDDQEGLGTQICINQFHLLHHPFPYSSPFLIHRKVWCECVYMYVYTCVCVCGSACVCMCARASVCVCVCCVRVCVLRACECGVWKSVKVCVYPV